MLDAFDKQSPLPDDNDVRYYRQLLSLQLKYVGGTIGVADFAQADSLCSFFRNKPFLENYAKSLLFRGNIFQLIDDHPSAIRDFLQAEDIGSKCSNKTLMQWVYSNTGDLYFKERSFDECKPYYRKCYLMAVDNCDTLRISYAALRMGRLYTINSNADSAAYYFQKAVDMGRLSPDAIDIVPVALSLLCDIYIQTEQFDKAAAIMPHDELNDENWAYWHEGKHHTDSAIYYFRQMLGKYGPYAEAQTLLHLAQLCGQKGDQRQALDYYRQYAIAEDSLRAFTQSEETRLAHAQFNVNAVTQERDEAIRKSRQAKTVLYGALLTFAIAMFIARLAYLYRQKTKDEANVHERLLNSDQQQRLQKSQVQLSENRRQIAQLEQQLTHAQHEHDQQKQHHIENSLEVLHTENLHIEALRKQQDALLYEFRCSPLYLKIIHNAGKQNFRLTEDEWTQIAENMDNIYDSMTSRLLNLATLREEELRTCYLLKLGLDANTIGCLLPKSYNALYMLRKRLYSKLTRKEGTAADLDAFIRAF